MTTSAVSAEHASGEFLIYDAHFANDASLPVLRLPYTTLGMPRRDEAG